MPKSLVKKFMSQRFWVVGVFFVFALAGIWLVTEIPIDAVPDITPVQVVINTKSGSLDPEQIEKTVSAPIETEVSGIAQVKGIRSLSKYGLSQVVVTFEDGTDIYWARQQVSERLQSTREQLPDGLSPELAPITTGLGEVVMYAVLPRPESQLAKKTEQEQLLYLRTIQDFVIRRHLKANVGGVAEVDSTGGYKKQIHIDLDPHLVERRGLLATEVLQKLERLGESYGGGYVEADGKQIIVRTQGSITQLDQIRNISLGIDVRGAPIRVKDVAAVREDFAQRVGAATFNGHEVVLGTVLMLSGANSREVALDTERALSDAPLPSDVMVKILYSRQFLVDATIKTVAKNLAEGAALVVIVLLLLLGSLRAALLVSLAIPLSMLFAAFGMKVFGVSANLMSLGAIDFGLLVDASVVIIENVLRRFALESPSSKEQRMGLVVGATKEVMGPVAIGLLLIMLVYVPVLALEGVEGKLFRPMVITVLTALFASLIVAIALMPVLAYMVLRPAQTPHAETFVLRIFNKLYRPILDFSLRYRTLVVLGVLCFGVFCSWLFVHLGADFMPPLNEGDMVVNLVRESDIGLGRSIEMQKKSDNAILSFPEVEWVFSRMGTPESATDPMGVNLSDSFVILKPEAKSRPKSDLFDALRDKIEKLIPGQEVMQTQPIEMRFNEILEGSRADVSLKIFGPDLYVLMQSLDQAKAILEKVPGASEVELDALTALKQSPVLNVNVDYEKVSRYGIDAHDVGTLIASVMGGHPVGSFYEGHWRFPIVARLTETCRENLDELPDLKVGLPDRGVVRLAALATINKDDQVTTIAHEGGQRYAAVAVNLDNRDIESFVGEAKAKVEGQLKLPSGYALSWGGQFKNLARAKSKLIVLVPLILIAIFLVMLKSFNSVRQACLIYASIPFAVTGGICSLAISGIPFSVSAAVGFIALIGIAILNAMVLVNFLNQLRTEGVPLEQAVREGTMNRLRPVLVTALVASLGFLPMAFNTGIGAEVQRPLATVVIGGLVSSTFLTLLVIPTLYMWLESLAEKTSSKSV